MKQIVRPFLICAFLLQSFNAVADVFRRPANIVGSEDNRATATVVGPALGLSSEEIDQIRRSVVFVNCPASRGQPAQTVTGFLVAKDVVVTVAHIFLDWSHQRRESLASCYVQSMGSMVMRIPIRPESLNLGSAFPFNDRANDYALVKLARPLDTARPLTVLASPEPLVSDSMVVAATAFRSQLRLSADSKDMAHEPLVQTCSIKKLQVGSELHPTAFFSDCDNTAGGLGSPNLIRVKGRLVAIGMIAASGAEHQNFKPYSEPGLKKATGEKIPFSGSYSLHLDARFLADVQSMLRSSSVIGSK